MTPTCAATGRGQFSQFSLFSDIQMEITAVWTPQWTNGLPATNQHWVFANNQKQKGKGLLLGTSWAHKFRAMVMWPLEWSHHSAPRRVKAQCRFWWERLRVQVLWSIISRCNQWGLWKWILPLMTYSFHLLLKVRLSSVTFTQTERKHKRSLSACCVTGEESQQRMSGFLKIPE